MDLMPIFCNLQQKRCLIVGGGRIAAHKAQRLLKAKAELVIVSLDFNDELLALGEMPNVTLVHACFDECWLEGCWLAVAATDNAEVNQHVYECATQRQIFCNVVDNPHSTSFITPAVIDHSPILIAMTTGGNAPVLSRLLRQQIESHLSVSSLPPLAQLAGYLRNRVKNHFQTTSEKQQFWLSFFTDPRLINAVEHQDTLAINLHIKRLMDETNGVVLSNSQIK